MDASTLSLLFFLGTLIPFALVAFRFARNFHRLVRRFEDPEQLARMVAAHRRVLADHVPEGEEPDIRVVIGDREFRWGDPSEAIAPAGETPVATPTPDGVGSAWRGRALGRAALWAGLAVLALVALRNWLA